MATSDRGLRSPFGRPRLIALITLGAAIGFTPWAWIAGAPWAELAFRILGLTALFAVSLEQSIRSATRTVWEARATRALFLFVLVSAISAPLSVHRGNSLEAMLNLLAITGIFLAAMTSVRGMGMLRGIAFFEVLVAIPVATLGILQHFRPELLPAANSYPGRALGPFGQPNRMGGYLIAMIPVALGLAFLAQDRALKAGLLLVSFGLVFCLAATYSRGAWLGLAAGLLVFAAAFARWPELMPRPAMLGLAVACLTLPFVALLPSVLSRVQPRPASGPAWNLPIDPERESSGAMRRAIWSGAIRAAMSRPVAGWGIGSFRQAYDVSKDATMKRLEAEGGRTADQAHNHYLGILAERGVLGLAAFAALTALTLGAAAMAMASGTQAMGRVLVAGLAGSVMALLAHGLFDDNLALIPHGTLLFAGLGLLAASPATARRVSGPSRVAARAGLVAAIVAAGISVLSFGGQSFAQAASSAASTGNPEGALARWRTATRLAPWRGEFAVSRAEAAERLASTPANVPALREAEGAYRKAIAINGADPVTRQELARLYLAHPDVWGNRGTGLALEQLRIAVAQNPYYAEIQNDLGVALLRSGDRPEARAAFGRAVHGRSGFIDPLLNLAALAIESGDRVEARSWLEQALQREPNSARARALLEGLGP